MKEEIETIEANKLIAQFMGLKCVKSDELGDEYEWLPTPVHSNWCFKSAPPYNTSWSWLMPVVEKIENIAAVTIINKACKIETISEVFTTSGLTTIDAVYAAVVHFIKWLKENN
jgi:hypothetical protein